MRCQTFDAPLGAKPVMTLIGSVQTTTLVVVMIMGAELRPCPGYEPGERARRAHARRAARERRRWREKRPQRLGRHLAYCKQGAARSLSANQDRRFKSGSRNQKERLRSFGF